MNLESTVLEVGTSNVDVSPQITRDASIMKRPMIIPNADIMFARDTLRSFAETVALSRALLSTAPLPYAMVVARGAAFDIATITWCILFGSDHEEHQQIHWKNMFEHEPFRSELLSAVNLTLEEWKGYRKCMVDYRNEVAAHRALNPETRNYPNFDTSLAAAAFYHDRLREMATTVGIVMTGPTLTEHYAERRDQFTTQMGAAVTVIR